MNFLKIVEETEEEFKTIAKNLFDNFAIITDEATYRFVEVEFYWNSPNHIDHSTYQRKHVDPKTGDWFFHYSGIDIALKNDDSGGYGGILIRSIYDIDKKIIVKGPMVCAMKLFSGTNAFSDSIKTKIVPHLFNPSDIVSDSRIGLGQNAKDSGTHKLNYRFVINPK